MPSSPLLYHKRIADGLCGRCGMSALFTMSRCEPCAKKNREVAKQTGPLRRNKYRALGLCAFCGRVPNLGRKTCEVCSKSARERSRKYVHLGVTATQVRRRLGKCVDCGDEPAIGKKHCAQCLRKISRYNLRRYGKVSEILEFKERNAVCAICLTTEDLCIDHNHKTGHLRGRLCRRCNHGIGCFGDKTELLSAAIKYLLACQATMPHNLNTLRME
jgi:hypothetical protein